MKCSEVQRSTANLERCVTCTTQQEGGGWGLSITSLCLHVEKAVAVGVYDVVAVGLLVVDEEGHGRALLHLRELGKVAQRLGGVEGVERVERV